MQVIELEFRGDFTTVPKRETSFDPMILKTHDHNTMTYQDITILQQQQ
jgi:hypothetical protein